MRRVYVVGFDGASWRFIKPLMERGDMPNFKKVMDAGVSGELTSTIPFQSAAAWVTFMTGKNSGRHGVYMFQDYDSLSYTYAGRTANSRYFSGQTIFDIVGELGGTVGVVRVPMTYPAWPVKGFMVSGFPTPGDTPDSFYPPELRQEMDAVGDPDPPDFRLLTTEQQVQTLENHMDRMGKLVVKLMEKPFDLFAVVHRVPDPVHHFFMKFVDRRTPAYNQEEASRWGDVVNRFYRRMDATLGETLEKLSPDDTLFVISDHGGAITPPRQVNVNVWLASRGFLVPQQRTKGLKDRVYELNQRFVPSKLRALVRQRAPKAVKGGLRDMWKGLQQVDFANSQAYHFPMKNPPLAGIVVNVRDRQPNGSVPPEKYEEVRERIMREVADLVDPRTGERIVLSVHRREDLYSGPFTERAPDIIVWFNDLYKEGHLAEGPLVQDVPFDELAQISGAHDEKGILLAMGPDIARDRKVDGARLIDVPPTILHAMELGVPADMDGRVLDEIFTEGGRSVESVDLTLGRQSEEQHLSEDEEQQIKEKLKGWGYM